jgi:hypothetical protein
LSISGKLIGLAILAIGALVYWSESSGSAHTDATQPQSPIVSSPSTGSTIEGYDCTSDCSGHEAGYRWAEEHAISDGDDCDTAGEHSNSPSFSEGCHAYVDGDSDSQPDSDLDDNNGDDN